MRQWPPPRGACVQRWWQGTRTADVSDNVAHQATASAARRARTTKVTQRTGINEAASDAKGNDVASRDDDSEVDANDDTVDDPKRAGQPKKVGERSESTAGGTYVRQPPPPTVTTTRTAPSTRPRRQGDRQGRRGNEGRRVTRTCGKRPQERREAGEGPSSPSQPRH